MRAALFGGVLIMVAASNQASAQEPLNVAEWSSAIEILKLAKTSIEEGWYQVTAAPGADCVSSALETAWKNSNKSLVDFDYARLAVNRAIDAPPLDQLTKQGDPLSTPYWGRYYVSWNDATGRTKEEVIEAFDTAIAMAEAERASAVEANLTEDNLRQFDNDMMGTLGFR
jgi:hypothetical protein